LVRLCRDSADKISINSQVPQYPHEDETFIQLHDDDDIAENSFYVDCTGDSTQPAVMLNDFTCPSSLTKMMEIVRELRIKRDQFLVNNGGQLQRTNNATTEKARSNNYDDY